MPHSKERIEHDLIRSHISPNSSGVLELGARYGTSSCALSKHVVGRGKVVSVEADPQIWPAIERNLLESMAAITATSFEASWRARR